MPNRALVLVVAAVLEARDQPSTYNSRLCGLNRPLSLHRIMPRCLPAHETLTGGRAVQSGPGD
jgi:hypothetical protein